MPAESGNGRSPGVEPHANYPDPDKKKMTDDAREIVEMFEAATGRRATDADRETAARLVGFPPDKIRDGIRKSVERSSEPVGSLKYCEMAIRRLAKPSRRTEPRPEAPCPVVAAEPLEPRGRFSDEQKAPVFDAARTFIYRFAAMGNTPSREAIRSHLVEWAIEGGHPLELVDEVYPPAAEAAG